MVEMPTVVFQLVVVPVAVVTKNKVVVMEIGQARLQKTALQVLYFLEVMVEVLVVEVVPDIMEVEVPHKVHKLVIQNLPVVVVHLILVIHKLLQVLQRKAKVLKVVVQEILIMWQEQMKVVEHQVVLVKMVTF
jgi:hypothetical protein